jgi:hypothetical protein
MASLRLIITPHLFIDIYCNTRTVSDYNEEIWHLKAIPIEDAES